jgi:hypothetical protein
MNYFKKDFSPPIYKCALGSQFNSAGCTQTCGTIGSIGRIRFFSDGIYLDSTLILTTTVAK